MSKNLKSKIKDTYNADSIDVYKGLSGVRRQPTMYISSTSDEGIFHILKEVIDNSIDECLAGHSDRVGVILDKNDIYVFDTGRGIPVEIHSKTKKSTLTTIFTVLHAGGKMRGGKGGYKQSVGIHGVGVSVTNALSKSLTVFTYRSGWYSQQFAKGKPVSEVKKTRYPKLPIDQKLKKGTIIKFEPDKTVFDKGAKLDKKKIEEFLDVTSYLHPKVKFFLYDGKKKKEYHQPKGLQARISKILEDSGSEKIGKPFIYQSDEVDVALQWSTNVDELLSSYVNGSLTDEGGTHVNGLSKAIVDTLKKHKGKRTKDYRAEDLRSGMVGVLNYKMSGARFDSQTKNKLISKEVTDAVFKKLFPELNKFFNSNKTLAKTIIRRAVEVREAHQQLKLSKSAAANLKTEKKGKSLLPAKLQKVTTKNPKEVELFLIEGDSAAGTAKDARDKRYQAALPLRGKIVNVYKDKKQKLLTSQTIIDILVSIGYDPSLKNPLSKIRCGKIILLTDADHDGAHIDILLLSLLQKVAPELFDKGMVYTVDAALYTYQKGKDRYYAKNLKELKKVVKGTFDFKSVTRIKGWGEVSPSVLRELAFDPKTRKLIKIEPISKEQLKTFVDIVGESSETRKVILGVN